MDDFAGRPCSTTVNASSATALFLAFWSVFAWSVFVRTVFWLVGVATAPSSLTSDAIGEAFSLTLQASKSVASMVSI